MFSTTFELYTSTRQAWESMLQACREAQESIELEQYIFIADEIGNRFIQIFEEKIKQGVKIRLLIDMAGSYSFYNSETDERLRKIGVEIKFFNIISPWRIDTFTSWFFRDHRKILIIDKKISFTGGTGIGFHMADWRDTNARMEGTISQEIMDSFDEMWTQSDKKGLVSRLKKSRKNMKKVDFIANTPYPNKRFLYHTLIEALRNAQKNIYITTPYLIPDRRFRRILRLASHRGVDVKIIIPQDTDVPIVESASHSVFTELLKSGVRIFTYQPFMLHAKTMVVDGSWATFGSFNFDNLSFLYNYEANVVTTDTLVTAKIQADFDEDLKLCKEVTYEEWEQRPFSQKFREFLVRPLRRFM